MRILITGAGGLLGGRLAVLLSPAHATTALIRNRPAPDGIEAVSTDLTDEAALTAALDRARPDAVIHCAALADPEVCEREPARSRLENETATRRLALACRAREARLITISTDLVFGGDLAFSKEASPARPLTEYGRAKLAAEGATLEGSSNSVVLRVSLIIGKGCGPRLTASEGVAQRLRRGEAVTLYEDEWRTPVDPESVAEAILAILRRPSLQGCYHIAGAERITRAALGERVARSFGLDASLIRRAPQSTHRGAPRPGDVSLNIDRAREELGWAPRPLDTALREGREG